MCGIFCSISRHEDVIPDGRTKQLLQHRGPDCTGQQHVLIGSKRNQAGSEVAPVFYATFLSTVLALRGTTVVDQPLRGADNDTVLCWNGEAWSIGEQAVVGNDSQLIFDKLCAVAATSSDQHVAVHATIQLLASIRGPYAFVLYDAHHKLLYYGRDCLGRRSLLKKATTDGTIVLSSVCDNSSGDTWAEVEADGIYVIDFFHGPPSNGDSLVPRLVPHVHLSEVNHEQLSYVGKSMSANSRLTRLDSTLPGAQSYRS